MRTCWVLDHPAHVRLLAPFLRSGQSNDVIIATRRSEVESLLDKGDGHLPRRQTHWVERAIGPQKRRIALARWRSSHAFLRQCCADSSEPIERIVAVGASIELMAWRSPVLRRTLSSIKQRWYISDTEVNHIAHSLALKAATIMSCRPIGIRASMVVCSNASPTQPFIESTGCMDMSTCAQACAHLPLATPHAWFFVASMAMAFMTEAR